MSTPNIASDAPRGPYTQALIDRLELAITALRAERDQLRAERDEARDVLAGIARVMEEMGARGR